MATDKERHALEPHGGYSVLDALHPRIAIAEGSPYWADRCCVWRISGMGSWDAEWNGLITTSAVATERLGDIGAVETLLLANLPFFNSYFLSLSLLSSEMLNFDAIAVAIQSNKCCQNRRWRRVRPGAGVVLPIQSRGKESLCSAPFIPTISCSAAEPETHVPISILICALPTSEATKVKTIVS